MYCVRQTTFPPKGCSISTKECIEANMRLVTSSGSWVGRVRTKQGKLQVVSVGSKGEIYDLSATGVWSVASLLQTKNPLKVVVEKMKVAPLLEENLSTLMENSLSSCYTKSHLISPHDLSSLKACGVVFIKSLLERVVEEAALGNPKKAAAIRTELMGAIGSELDKVHPGSPQALHLLKILTEEKNISRHYLEVGLGVNAEVFTKGQAMSSVGFGAKIGIHPKSVWNNPEPELVLVISRFGDIVGCTLGNDVNLRDFEGRSALLLGRAKDNNGSCSMGPLVRLFDETFTLDDARKASINLSIKGVDGFSLIGSSSMKEIGRDLVELKDQTINQNHQYPDGLFLMTGTMFAPVEDRDPVNQPGQGFTHHTGDEVIISSDKIGALVNYVDFCDRIPRWEYGICDLLQDLRETKRAEEES
eukprot:TRINITY_DN10445_c0_g1_i1.p1 TRINITY_DN10445_c0_g1~~TRINITY_DN10445_c0_g1_i1.p1  ORF type:complete len:417 (+),score=77.25 TRINITY_DN10445_c0_g1_i1:233-1483(+)